MSALEPGLYRATVRGVADVTLVVTARDLDVDGCNHMSTTLVKGCFWHLAGMITDARPLIVLDLSPFISDAQLVSDLRDSSNEWAFGVIANQIEAQTKPARIPEPGWDGKVLAHTERNSVRREFVRYGVRPIPTHFNWNDSLGNGAKQWGDLIDPTLIREGVTP